MVRMIILVARVLITLVVLSHLSSRKAVKKVHVFAPIALPFHALPSYTMIGFMVQWLLV
jgi:hypothetical protein